MAKLPVDARALAVTVSSSPRRKQPSKWVPSATVPAELWDRRHKLLRTSEPLTWLHKHWDLTGATDTVPAASSRGKTLVRQGVWRVVRPCLDRYFKEERDVVANLVRTVDLLAKRVDDLVANEQRLLGALRSDLQDLAQHVDETIAGLGAGA